MTITVSTSSVTMLRQSKLAANAKIDISAAGGTLYAKDTMLELTRSMVWPCAYGLEANQVTIDPVSQIKSYLSTLEKWHQGGWIFAVGFETFYPDTSKYLNPFIYSAVNGDSCQIRKIALFAGREYQTEECSMLIVDNIHPGMTEAKLTRLYDLLYMHKDIPVVLVIHGMDPLSFCRDIIHRTVKGCLFVKSPTPHSPKAAPSPYRAQLTDTVVRAKIKSI